jgi:hypothetical protein
MADIRIKRGATLSLTLLFTNSDGTAFDLTTVTMTASVADPRGNLITPLTIAPVAGSTGVATITVLSTATWPEGLMQADIVLSNTAGTSITQSFGIRVERPVTQLAPDPAPYNPVLSP